jgi:hypothetical protein
MARPIRREDAIDAFRPIISLLRDVVSTARKATTFDVVAADNPDVRRDGHIKRLAGTKRWILVADGLVDGKQKMPEGFGVESSEEDHNAGRYVFRFPGGVFTVKRQPHQDDEGVYLQERLDAIIEQAELAEGIDAGVDLKVFIAVPAAGSGRLIVTHPTLEKPMTILFDEIREAETAPMPARPIPPRGVRSASQQDSASERSQNPVDRS